MSTRMVSKRNATPVAVSQGFPDLHICMAETFGLSNPYEYGCDSAVQFPPHGTNAPVVNSAILGLPGDYRGEVYNYADVVASEIGRPPPPFRRYRSVFPAWDNTPRRGLKGNVFFQSTPELYELWLREMVLYTRRNLPAGQQLIFINAWNEWGEGAHLEPDMKYGRSYLEATRRAIYGTQEWPTLLAQLRNRSGAHADAQAIIDEIETVLRSYEQSTQFLSRTLLSTQRSIGRSNFVEIAKTVLDGVEVAGDVNFNIEQINNNGHKSPVTVHESDVLEITGWAFVPGRKLEPTSDVYISLISLDGVCGFAARVRHLSQRGDVVQYYSVTEGEALWSGIHLQADLRGIASGEYMLHINVHLDGQIFRSTNGRVIRVLP